MRLFLHHEAKPHLDCEVLAFDRHLHVARLQRPNGEIYVDHDFHPYILKRVGYTLTQDIPEKFKENVNAQQS